MSASLAELVEAFASISLAAEVDDLERLELALAERQTILAAIQNADASLLSPELRTELEQRVVEVLARDVEVLEYLNALREHTIKSLEDLSSGRAAVRGYGEALGANENLTRRIG
jgi:hypothetical protein